MNNHFLGPFHKRIEMVATRPLGIGSNVRMNDRQKEDILNYLGAGNVYLKVKH